MPKPVAFAHPTMRSLRPKADPAPQVEACTALRDDLLAEGVCERVTTMLPKRGGVALMIGWQGPRGRRGVPVVGPYSITPEGEVDAV